MPVPGQRPRESVVRLLPEEDEYDFLHLRAGPRQMCCRLSDGNHGSLIEGVSVCAGADGRERDTADATLLGHLEAGPVAFRQQFRFAIAAAAVDRADGVEDVPRIQPSGAGRDRVARGALPELLPDLIQFRHNGRPAGAVDRAIDAAAAGQRGVGRVHDGISRHPGDVAGCEHQGLARDGAPLGLRHAFTLPQAATASRESRGAPRYHECNMTRREILVGAAAASALWGKTRIGRAQVSAITDEIGKTADDAIAFARRYDLQWVELRAEPETRKEYAWLPVHEVKAAAAALKRHGLKVSFLNTSLLKFAWPGTEPVRRRPETPEAREKRLASAQARYDRRVQDLEHAIRNAHILGVDKIRVFTGMRVAEPRALFPRIADVLGEMASIAAREKVYLLVENEASCNVASSAETADLLKLLPSKWIGLNWDPQNTLGTKETPFPDGYGLLPKSRILNVQVKGRGIMPESDQRLDWKAIIQALQRDNYKGKIGLETHIFDGTLIESSHISIKELLRVVGEV